jgi:hypothetical protein
VQWLGEEQISRVKPDLTFATKGREEFLLSSKNKRWSNRYLI